MTITTKNGNNIDKNRAKFETSIQYAEFWLNNSEEQNINNTKKILKILKINEKLIEHLKNNIDKTIDEQLKKIIETLKKQTKNKKENNNILKKIENYLTTVNKNKILNKTIETKKNVKNNKAICR